MLFYSNQVLELVDLPNERTLRELARRYPHVRINAGALEAGILLLKTATEIFQSFEAYLKKFQLSQGRFSVLMLLMREPKRAQAPSELACRAGVTRATMTGLIDGLERDGFVQRKHDPNDRRRLKIALTSKGLKYMDRILPAHFTRMTFMMQFTPSECKALKKSLEKLRLRIKKSP